MKKQQDREKTLQPAPDNSPALGSDRRSVNTYRGVLALSATVYGAWWFLVEAVLPGAFNPGLGRITVVLVMVAALALTFVNQLAQRHVPIVVAACMWLLTGHYFYLYAGNQASPEWITGAYITVLAVGATFERPRALALYSAFVLAVMAFAGHQTNRHAVGVPGMATVLLLLNTLSLLWRRSENERLRRQQLDTETAAAAAVANAKMLFLANISHELRTPLTSIVGYSDLLKESGTLAPTELDQVNRINRNGHALLGLVDQLLSLTESHRGSPEQQAHSLRFRQLLTEIIKEHQAELDAGKISVSTDVDPEIPEVLQFDATNLRRIFENVFVNAIKFNAPDAGGKIAIQARRLHQQPYDLEILVEDTGIGIAPEHWEMIFDSFTQVQNRLNRPYGGSGVGLTVARRLARALSGDVSVVTSTPGQGSLFRIALKTTPTDIAGA